MTDPNLLNAIFPTLPAWAVMWTLAVGMFSVFKLLTWVTAGGRMTAAASAAYLCGWPGLDPAPFRRSAPRSGHSARLTELLWAWGKTLFGAALIWVGVRLVPAEWTIAAVGVGVVGLGFLLHFGGFHVLALLWRTAGYDVQLLMDAPHRATSLTEFWSRRWNAAFRDLSHRFILRPLLPRLGLAGATLAVFLFSGVVHDVVISIPAQGGYGLPTLYFLLQAIGLFGQRTHLVRGWGWNRGARGWVTTAVFVLVPLPLLFHEPFLTRVVLPFLAAIGAY